MEPTDLTVRVLQDIREEIRGLRGDQQEFREEQRAFSELAMARFEVIETTLRDLAEQLVMLGRGVKVAIQDRVNTSDRLDQHERRIGELEKRLPS